MGTKYSSNAISGYNATPPSDDGQEVAGNEITWVKHKEKLADPIKALAEQNNSDLVTHFNVGPIAKTANFELTAAEYNQVVEFDGAGLTATLPDANAIGLGFFSTIVNASTSQDLTVDLATGTDTLQGVVDGSVTLSTGKALKVIVNNSANGYLVLSIETLPPTINDKGQWPTVANGADPIHDIDTTTGSIFNHDRTVLMTASSTFGKQIDADWVPGGTPGVPLGGIASAVTLGINQALHFFIIARTDDPTIVDYGFDTSITAANLLADAQLINANFTLYRRIASFLTDASSNLRAFTQIRDDFYYNNIETITYSNHGTSQRDTVVAPTGLDIHTLSVWLRITTLSGAAMDLWPGWSTTGGIFSVSDTGNFVWEKDDNETSQTHWGLMPLDTDGDISTDTTNPFDDIAYQIHGYRDNRGA